MRIPRVAGVLRGYPLYAVATIFGTAQAGPYRFAMDGRRVAVVG